MMTITQQNDLNKEVEIMKKNQMKFWNWKAQ